LARPKRPKVKISNYNMEMYQCFSTGVPRNLRVVSKGSAKSNRETGTKRNLRPSDACCGLFMHPKCICSRGSAPNPTGGDYSTPPDLLAAGAGLAAPPQEPFPRSRPLASNFSPWGLMSAPNKNSWLRLWVPYSVVTVLDFPFSIGFGSVLTKLRFWFQFSSHWWYARRDALQCRDVLCTRSTHLKPHKIDWKSVTELTAVKSKSVNNPLHAQRQRRG